MIQRIQTVYLALAALVLGGVLFIPGINTIGPAQRWPWFMLAFLVLTGLVAVVALGAIFQYGTRDRQQRTVGWAQLLAGLTIIAFAVANVLAPTEGGRLPWLGVLPHIVSLVLLLLARRAIRRDIHLIRSMDRLRD